MLLSIAGCTIDIQESASWAAVPNHPIVDRLFLLFGTPTKDLCFSWHSIKNIPRFPDTISINPYKNYTVLKSDSDEVFLLLANLPFYVSWREHQILTSPDVPLNSLPEYLLMRLKTFISIYLIKHHGLGIHCASAVKNKRGFLFCGNSGAGKTTISKYLVENGWQIYNDEYNAIIERSSRFNIFSTPFTRNFQNDTLCSQGSSALQVIFFLEKGDRNEIVELSETRKKLSALMSVSFFLPGLNMEKDVFLALQNLINRVKIYKLKFVKNMSVCSYLHQFADCL